MENQLNGSKIVYVFNQRTLNNLIEELIRSKSIEQSSITKSVKLKEAAKLLGIHYISAYKIRKQLNAYRVGRTYYVDINDIEQFKENKKNETALKYSAYQKGVL